MGLRNIVARGGTERKQYFKFKEKRKEKINIKWRPSRE
jgi:hypothetical protein